MSLDPTDFVPPSGTEFLEHLADVFTTLVDADDGDGLLVSVTPKGDSYDVGTVPLEGRWPPDVLLGSVAPDDWWALGVVARGWLRPLRSDGSPGPRAGRTGSVVLVNRDGGMVARLKLDGKWITETPSYGATVDCLLRAFDLPTAPPDQPTGLAFAQQWLTEVCAVAERRAARLTWREIEALHPARKVAAGDPGLASSPLLELAQLMGRVVTWDRLRWLAVEGSYPVPGLTGSDAAWFDAGSFSRWVVGGMPALPDLLDRVDRLAGTATAKRCHRVLRHLGLLARGGWRPAAA